MNLFISFYKNESNRMITRSQVKEKERTFGSPMIDFDEASRCWLQNKKRLASGTYVYVCGAELKCGAFCQRKPERFSDHCYMHKTKCVKMT